MVRIFIWFIITLNYNKEGINMISRIWHGWTTPANADAYETLLKNEIFVGIGNHKITVTKEYNFFAGNWKTKLSS